MTSRRVELRSDTFTRPTEAMRRAMYEAEVGDDVWDEDPTVHRLEERAAELTGKAAAVFVSSGTQGNLTGILAHTNPGDEILLGDQSHVFWYEVAGTAVVGGLQTRPLPNGEGRLDPELVQAAIRAKDIHFPPTGLLVLENTHNRCGGTVSNREQTLALTDIAHSAGIPVHLDGARVFNAAVALGIPVAALTEPVDSVTFCLSKGLGAPVGSVLCGEAHLIERARRWRKMLGGGMRQVGVLAAAGLVALSEQVERLAEDHANARVLAEGLAQIPGIRIDPRRVETNIVFFSYDGRAPENFLLRLAEQGVLLSGAGGSIRAVTCYEATSEDIDFALRTISQVARERAPVPA
jgi:threonine aldolase